jgi:LAO/AO transport system kinase
MTDAHDVPGDKNLDSPQGDTAAGTREESGGGRASHPSGPVLRKVPRRRTELSLDDYFAGVRAGDRTILSRAITLVESTRAEHRELAHQLIQKILPYSGNSVRIGITGVPGVGKSSFIESFGVHLASALHKRLAVLAVDPSSTRSGGSILGDKTRMQELAARDDVFIRPSPSCGSLGGVTRASRETILLCEAAGYDTILLETVGVGQSETTVHGMVDFFLLLVLAGAGDELQGIKRGIMEMADGIVVTKADGSNRQAAELARHTYKNALHLFPPAAYGWTPEVLTCSAHHHVGIAEVWDMVDRYALHLKNHSYWQLKREIQLRSWLKDAIISQIEEEFFADPVIVPQYQAYEEKIVNGTVSPFKAASELVRTYRTRHC